MKPADTSGLVTTVLLQVRNWIVCFVVLVPGLVSGKLTGHQARNL